MWRFDGRGGFPQIDPPTEWSAQKNILWKTPVPVGGYSSPIVVGDRVFVTGEMGSLACLDLADGKLLWSKDLFSKDSPDIPPEISKGLMRGCGGDSKQSTPTPTSNGRLVFYINAMGLCSCYDLAGREQWIRVIETAEDEEHFSASPIFVGDRIIVSWGCLLALDAHDGRTLWKATEALPTHGTPALTTIGDVAVAITPGGDIVRLADGEILCSGLFDSLFTTPWVEGNQVYVVDRESVALELPAVAAPGMKPTVRWKTRLKGEFMASPILHDGLLYSIESAKYRLHILDARTGELLTARREQDETAPGEKLEPGPKVDGLAPAKFAYASPVAVGGRCYVFDDAGHAAVLKLGRQYQPGQVNQLDDALVGTPFFVANRIILRGSKAVYCIGTKP
jgi:outer membrane protein assembly factor BamB